MAGLGFPLVVALLIPLRKFVLPKLFKAEHLQALDAMNTPPPPATSMRDELALELHTAEATASIEKKAHAEAATTEASDRV